MSRKIAIFAFIAALTLTPLLLQGCGFGDSITETIQATTTEDVGASQTTIESDDADKDEDGTQTADDSEAWAYFEENVKNQTVIISTENDVDIAAKLADDYSKILGMVLSANDFAIEFVYYSWLDYVDSEQLEIVREFLGLPVGGFDDAAVFDYLVNAMGSDLVRTFDRTPFEDMSDDPERIIVRMWEAYSLVSNEFRIKSALEQGIDPNALPVYTWGLDRIVVDWR